jgi:peroxiredoxin
MAREQSNRRLLGLCLLAALCSLCAAGCSDSGSGSAGTAEELGLIYLEEETAAPDFTLPTLTGAEITLSELHGTAVVLNFWAVKCPPCTEELPYFDTVARHYANEAAIIAVNVLESTSKVQQFFGDSEVHFTVALDGSGQVTSNYGIRFTPTTFFIDSQGLVRYAKVGPFASERELEASIDMLLNL